MAWERTILSCQNDNNCHKQSAKVPVDTLKLLPTKKFSRTYIHSYINIYLQHWSARNVGMFLHILPLLPRNCAFCIQILHKHTHTHTHPHTNIRIKTVFAFASCSAIFVWHLLQSFVHPMRQHVANWYFKLVVVCYVGRLLWFGRCCKSIPCVGNFQLHQT